LTNEILETLEKTKAWASKRPPVVAASVLDYIRSITAIPIQQSELADMFAVTEVAIRQRKRDITEVLQPLAEKIRAEIEKQ
jgi:transcription initiation factor TFIIIB Brf1 subunit/transcription initiation factor TFIIB